MGATLNISFHSIFAYLLLYLLWKFQLLNHDGSWNTLTGGDRRTAKSQQYGPILPFGYDTLKNIWQEKKKALTFRVVEKNGRRKWLRLQIRF